MDSPRRPPQIAYIIFAVVVLTLAAVLASLILSELQRWL